MDLHSDVQRLRDLSRTPLHPIKERATGGAHAFPAYKRETLHEREFRPAAAPEFIADGGDKAVEWLLDDILPFGGLALLASKPKEGKSTLVYELAVHVAKGHSFLGRATTRGGVLIVALEEHPRDVRLRLQALGAGTVPNLYVHCGSLEPSPTNLEAVKRFIAENAIKLVVVDTLAAFWRLSDENDAAAVTRAVKPLLALARETGACVLLIHHTRKSEGSYGDEIRGSGALFALADVALILKRHAVQNQRILHGVSRYPETPTELVIELRETGYVALGDPSALNKQARQEKVKEALSEEPEEAETIMKRAGVSLRDGYRLLAALVESNEAIREGKGRKGSPYRYRRIPFPATPQSYRQERESVPADSDSCSPRPPA